MMDRDRGDHGSRPSFVPVKPGDQLEVTIDAVGEKGDGLARKDGFVLFVPNTRQGDRVTVRVTKVLRRVGFAEVVGAGQGKSAAPAAEEPSKDEEASAGEESTEGDSEEESDESEDSEDFGEESR